MGQLTIINKFIENPSWLDGSICNFRITSGIDIWSVGISAQMPHLATFLKVISPDEQERTARFYQQKDRDRYLISRAALRYILGRYTAKYPENIEFGLGLNKKPFLKNIDFELHFNMSHSEDKLLVAVSRSEIGADIEFINPRFSFKEVLADNFSDDEIKYIMEADSYNRFYRVWTRKEAITKATAQGLDCDLRLLPGLDGVQHVRDGIIASNNNWMLSSFSIDENYMGSIAASPSVQNLKYFTLPEIYKLALT